MGIIRIGDKHRRIDMKAYPVELHAFALLYFTGGTHFNRGMRLVARRRGLSLSDLGLRSCVKDGNGEKVKGANIAPCWTEHDVFALLDLEYRPPTQRQNAADVRSLCGELLTAEYFDPSVIDAGSLTEEDEVDD